MSKAHIFYMVHIEYQSIINLIYLHICTSSMYMVHLCIFDACILYQKFYILYTKLGYPMHEVDNIVYKKIFCFTFHVLTPCIRILARFCNEKSKALSAIRFKKYCLLTRIHQHLIESHYPCQPKYQHDILSLFIVTRLQKCNVQDFGI